MKRRPASALLAVLAAAGILLTACGGSKPAATETPAKSTPDQKVELRYMLWDSAQQPAYEACAAEFTKANPNITVKIEQMGWNDYWNSIQTGFVSGTAPDVFTNHLAKYPEFATKGQLVDIDAMVKRDKVDLNQYLSGLADLWTKSGKRYGLPKDWDTIAIAYNADMFKKAGVDPKITETWTWNPQDGGTFEKTIKQLTLDKNGKNALDPAFDKNNVVQYGFVPPGNGGAYGQSEWTWLAYTTGWKMTDGLWATKYNYDDKRFIDTIQWYADRMTIDHTFVPLADVKSLGASALYGNQKAAMAPIGSWAIGEFKKAYANTGFGRLPIGPVGRRSMFNGLADSIWAGTKHVEESWKLVKFLASPTCEDIVGQHNVVFPAIQSGVDKRLEKAKAEGTDVSAFTKQATEKDGTFLFPITDNASQIATIMDETMDSIMLGQKKAAEALPEATKKVNAVFK